MSIPNTSEKSNDLDRQENLTKGNLSAKKVVVYSYDSSSDTIIPGLMQEQVTQRYDYSSSTVIYVGTAPIGTADSETGWTITKYDLTSSNDASGKVATDVSWDDKSTGSYA